MGDHAAESTRPRTEPSASGHFLIQKLNLNYPTMVVAVVAIYFAAGKFGLSFASFNPSSSPVWPPAGIAFTALMLAGLRIWPAVFVGAFLVDITTAGAVLASLGVASGNTLEAVVGAYLTVRCA